VTYFCDDIIGLVLYLHYEDLWNVSSKGFWVFWSVVHGISSSVYSVL